MDMLTRSMLHSMKATKQAPTTQKRRATPPDASKGAGREEAEASPAPPEGGGGKEQGGVGRRRREMPLAQAGVYRPDGEADAAGAGLERWRG